MGCLRITHLRWSFEFSLDWEGMRADLTFLKLGDEAVVFQGHHIDNNFRAQ
jgi:hypothetical protein